MSSWHSYPQVFALGHKAVADLLLDPVIVQEKVDGSQINFGRFDGKLYMKSKSAILYEEEHSMFNKAIEVIRGLDLKNGWTYRGEYLMKPKHNTMAYNRVPINYIALFDVNVDEEHYLDPWLVQEEAQRIGIDCVPTLYEGKIHNIEEIKKLIKLESFLGSPHIEGIVIKNYNRFGPDKHALMGKYVSEVFKETHKREWKGNGKGDILQQLVTALKTEARWRKGVEHLREKGVLLDAPQDIGNLLKEVKADIRKEEEDWIKEKLFNEFIDSILRGTTAGLPEWYKQQLLEKQFEHGGTGIQHGTEEIQSGQVGA